MSRLEQEWGREINAASRNRVWVDVGWDYILLSVQMQIYPVDTIDNLNKVVEDKMSLCRRTIKALAQYFPGKVNIREIMSYAIENNKMLLTLGQPASLSIDNVKNISKESGVESTIAFELKSLGWDITGISTPWKPL